MIAHGAFAQRYPADFRPSSDVPIIALAEHLIHRCGPVGSILDRRDGKCWCRPISGGEAIEIPVPPQHFRMFLARVAVLCNEYEPDSVSPYGGEGVLIVGGEPRAMFRVSFTNTPDTQRLEIRPAVPAALNGAARPA